MSETNQPPAAANSGSAAGPLKRGGSKKGRKVRQPSQLLRDMRLVYRQPQEKDSTPGQHVLRKMLEENPRDFIAQLQKAEQAHRAGRARESKPAPDNGAIVKDEGTERCLAILDEYLTRKPWEAGPCPTCGREKK